MLGVDPDDGFVVALGEADSSVHAALTAALEQRRRVLLDYHSHGRGTRTTRTVSPWRLQSTEGAWYLRGWCHDAAGERRFRVDRIASATLEAEAADPVPDDVDLATSATFTPAPDDPRVVLDLGPAARWVAGRYPLAAEPEERPDGTLRVVLQIAGPAFLERLLLGLGPAVAVVHAPPRLAEAGRTAATRLLARYR